MRPARRPLIRLIAPSLAAAALCVAAPAARADWFGLKPNAPAAPPAAVKKPRRLGGLFGLRPDSGVVAAGHVAGPACGAAPAGHVVPDCGPGCHDPAICGAAGATWRPSFGLVPDAGGAGGPKREKPIHPPGGRQVEKHGLLWPPYPRSTAPKASVSTQFHHAHYWPLPYSCRDRAFVKEFMARQVAAGVTEHAALHDFHFHPDTHELTDAGRERLQAAVLTAASAGTTSPIVVAAGARPEVGYARLARVQSAVAELGAPQLAPSVSLGHGPAIGRPAEEINRLRLDELQSTPQPRIPVATFSTGSTGS